MALYAKIIPGMSNSQIDKMFDYEIPFEMLNKIETGMRVKVPFGGGNSLAEGYVIDICDSTDVPEEKIKLIHSIVDKFSLLDKDMTDMAWWMKKRYLATFSSCLRTLLPAGADIKNTVKSVFVADRIKAQEFVDKNKGKAKFEGQVKVLEYLLEKESEEEPVLRQILGLNVSPINTLEKNGLVYFGKTRRRR